MRDDSVPLLECESINSDGPLNWLELKVAA